MKVKICSSDFLNPSAFAIVQLDEGAENCKWLNCYVQLATDERYALMSGYVGTEFIQLVTAEAHRTILKMTNAFLSSNFDNQLRVTGAAVEWVH